MRYPGIDFHVVCFCMTHRSPKCDAAARFRLECTLFGIYGRRFIWLLRRGRPLHDASRIKPTFGMRFHDPTRHPMRL